MCVRSVRPIQAAVVVVCLSFVGGCVAVPPLQPLAGSEPDPKNSNPKSISINDVVVRVKCELRDSIEGRTGRDYDWMNKWTAQADLQLAVNDQSSIAPGATFTNPLPVANIPGRVSNMAQSASLGIGASASTTAARTEIVSFSVSLQEIRDEFKTMTPAQLYEECNPRSSVGLTGDLGLKEWVDSALGPVENHLLKPGRHSAPKAPSGGGGAAVSGGGKPQALTKIPQSDVLVALLTIMDTDDELTSQIALVYDEYQLLVELSQMLKSAQLGAKNPADWNKNDFSDHLKNFTGLLDTLGKFVPKDPGLMAELKKLADPSKIQKVYDGLPKTPSTPSKAQLAALLAVVQTATMSLEQAMVKDIPPTVRAVQMVCDCAPPTDSEMSKKFSDALKCLNTLLNVIKANVPAKPAPLDPPIDAISHQLQFIVALSANANPSWSLVRFKGPTPSSGNFASLNGTNTDTLTITIGVPGSQAAVNARSTLTLSTALANQLIPAQLANPSAPIIP